MVTLISLLKLWCRVLEIPSKQLNSYTISLMVIYFLQCCSSPVLPSLQQPGQWPRNMEWYKEGGEGVENQVERKLVAPWDVTFLSPHSFSPSANSDTTGT